MKIKLCICKRILLKIISISIKIKFFFKIRSLRLDKIVLDSNGHCKLLNSTESTKYKEPFKQKLNREDSLYCSPEYLIYGKCEHSVDFWALGIAIYKMLTGNYPFLSLKDIKDSGKEYPSLYHFHISIECKDIIANLLNNDKTKRLGSQRLPNKAKNHSFFKDIDWDKLEKGELIAPFIPIVVNSLLIITIK